MFLMASVFALFPAAAGYAAGVSMEAIPSIRLEEGWDSNVFNASTDEVSSFGTRVSPGLALKFTSVDNVMLQISGNYDKIWYQKTEAKDADYNTWFFRVDSTGGWKLTPNFSVLPSVFYVNTNNSSRRSQLVPSGDLVLPPVTITNYGETKTEEFGGRLNLNFLVTENFTIGVNGNYSEQRFSDNTTGSGLANSTTSGANASFSYIFSPRTSLGFLVSGSHQTYQNAPDADTLSGGLLFGYQFSEALRLDGNVGMSYIRQKEGSGVPGEQTSAPSGSFNIAYTSAGFTAQVFGSAVYSGGSGFGQATRQYTTGLAFTDQFTREWSGNLSGAYQVSRSVFVTDAVNLHAIVGSAGLSYKPWVWGGLDLTGNLNRQTSDGQFGQNLNVYSAVLGITISKPYTIF